MDRSTSGQPTQGGTPADQWYIDEMLAQYRRDPSSVDQSWRDYFAAALPAPEPVSTPPEGRGNTGAPAPAPVGDDGPGTGAEDPGVPPQL
ncbi:2-oxoglutarate dehydrogenase E1 subunit family protein, partial [Actinomyces sp.]